MANCDTDPVKQAAGHDQPASLSGEAVRREDRHVAVSPVDLHVREGRPPGGADAGGIASSNSFTRLMIVAPDATYGRARPGHGLRIARRFWGDRFDGGRRVRDCLTPWWAS